MVINSIIEDLSWNKSYNIQKDAVERILKDKDFDYSLLIQPNAGKDCWDNCAKILIQLDYEKIIPYPELYEWLQDLNWPGSITIRNWLKTLPIEKIQPYLWEAIREAVETKDEIWLENLCEVFFDLLNSCNNDR